MTKTIARHRAGEPLPSADWNDAASSIEKTWPNAARGRIVGTGPSSAPVELLPPMINITEPPYNCVGNNTTDNTTALQAAFDDANAANQAIFIPPASGDYLTGTINYKMQSIVGTHPEKCALRGKPGQDILHVDPTFGQFTRMYGRLEKFTLRLDDSVNAAASFPNRGGVGNACYAMDFNDSLVTIPYPPSTLGWVYNHIRFASLSETSGGLNNSAGIYEQSNHFMQCVWYRPHFYRLQYGWWDHWPNLNISGRALSHDHVSVYQPHFNLNKNNIRWVNWGFGEVQDLILHDAVGGTSVEFKAVTAGPSNSRNFHDLHISSVEMENATTAGLVTDDGCYNLFIQNMTMNGTPAIVWNASQSVWRNVGMVPTGNPTTYLTINGNENDFEVGMDRGTDTDTYGWNAVSDLGAGNKVVINRRTGSLSPSMRRREAAVPDGRVIHLRDTVSQLLGHVDPMFVSGNDLIIAGRDMIPSAQTLGTDYSYPADTAADFRVAYRSLRSDGIVNLSETVWGFNGKNGARVGSWLPPTKLRVYFKAKLATAGTMSFKLRTASGSVIRNVGGAGYVASLGTTYSVFSFDADLTGRPVDEILDFRVDTLAGGGVTPLDIAWTAFRPWAKDSLIVSEQMNGTDNGNADKTLVMGTDVEIQRWNTALTVARNITLPTAGMASGDRFRIVRDAAATGAFALNINGPGLLKALATNNTWAEVHYDGTAWRLTAAGAL